MLVRKAGVMLGLCTSDMEGSQGRGRAGRSTFMASSTTRDCPFFTWSPTLTSTCADHCS